MKIEPLNGNAFVKEEKINQTESGILLSTEQKEGSIVTIYEIEENENDLKAGDKIIVSRYVLEDAKIPQKGGKLLELKTCPIDSILARIYEI